MTTVEAATAARFSEDVACVINRQLSSAFEANVDRLPLQAVLTRSDAELAVSMRPLLEIERISGNAPEGEAGEPPTSERVISAVALEFDCPLEDLMSSSRRRRETEARHVAVYSIRELIGTSYPQLGVLFSGRDHSSIINGYQRVVERLADPRQRAFSHKVASILAQFTKIEEVGGYIIIQSGTDMVALDRTGLGRYPIVELSQRGSQLNPDNLPLVYMQEQRQPELLSLYGQLAFDRLSRLGAAAHYPHNHKSS